MSTTLYLPACSCSIRASPRQQQVKPTYLLLRREVLLGLALGLGPRPVSAASPPPPPSPAAQRQAEQLAVEAAEAWAAGSVNRACELWDAAVLADPGQEAWLEARGQARLDAKRFQEAVADMDEVLRRSPGNPRALAARALASEGLAAWDAAIADYTQALAVAGPDPFVLNSRGTALAAAARFEDALGDYAASALAFERARQRDASAMAAANAALMRVQLGDEEAGMRELAAVARRAPGSVDARAALAALHWGQGLEGLAEQEWRFACYQIESGDGCALYRDQDWLRRIRRWPPVMLQRMADFLHLRSKQLTSDSP